MAEIFLARLADATLSKLIAIKRILPKHMDDPSFREMFRREGSIALRFRHHAIVAVNELGKIGGQYFLSMEFFPGKTLSKVIESLRDDRNGLDVLDKILIIKNIAEALQYVHDFRDYGDFTEIIHRDISPHNIMVGFDGAAKLIDFGIAKIKGEGTNTTSIKGKIAYMSPEQVRGDQLTTQTDIFSLGIVMWELLAGRKLFTGKTIDEVSRKVEACHVPSLSEYVPGISVKLDWICQKALAKNLQFRYRTAADLASDLDSILRMSTSENYQKHLAKSMQVLFPDDVRHLKEQLKKYEGNDDTPDWGTQIMTVPTPPPPPLRVEPPHVSKTKSAALAVKAGVAGSLFCIALALLVHLLKTPAVPDPVPPRAAVEERPAQQQSPPVVQQPSSEPPAISHKTVVPPAPSPVHPQPPPPVVPQPVQEPVATPTPPPKPVASKPAPKPHEPPAQTEAPPKPVRKASKEPKRPERKVASKPQVQPQPLPANVAYVTVLADPKAKIWINGKLAGTEVVNEYKVPADTAVSIKVAPPGGKPVTQQFTFQPRSRNVLELGSSPDPAN